MANKVDWSFLPSYCVASSLLTQCIDGFRFETKNRNGFKFQVLK